MIGKHESNKAIEVGHDVLLNIHMLVIGKLPNDSGCDVKMIDRKFREDTTRKHGVF